jgi:hypothetical protein
MITLTWLLLIGLIGGALALVDGILRLRARRGSTIIGIIEIVVAALFAGGRTGRSITVAAVVFIAVWLILLNRWLVIPGVN